MNYEEYAAALAQQRQYSTGTYPLAGIIYPDPNGRGSYFPPPPQPLPEPGIEVELVPSPKGLDEVTYRVRLTVDIDPELISATKERDRAVLIQVSFSEKVKKAAKEIVGKIAMARLHKSYNPKPEKHSIGYLCNDINCPQCGRSPGRP